MDRRADGSADDPQTQVGVSEEAVPDPPRGAGGLAPHAGDAPGDAGVPVREAPEADLGPDEQAEGLTPDLLRALRRLRNYDLDVLVAAIPAPDGDTRYWLTFGDLRALTEFAVAERVRANRAARDAADVRDLLDAVREELKDLRERYAELATERDVLAVELDEARGPAGRPVAP